MKIQVKIEGPNHAVLFEGIIDVSTAALRGRPESEIDFIVDQYVQDWSRSIVKVQWNIVDQSSLGLEYKPSEPRDD